MSEDTIRTKLCNTCGIVKPVSEFHRDRHKTDGFHTMCKKCKRAYRTSDFYSAREHELEHIGGRFNRHFKKRNVLFDSNDGGRSYKAIQMHAARSSLPRESHTLTYTEWAFIQKNQDNKCAICGSKEPLVHDCMIPLSMGGAPTFDNTQALCASCNNHKGAKAYGGISGNRWRKDFDRSVAMVL